MIQTIGAILGLWGVFWMMWDHKAFVPGLLVMVGLTALIIGGVMGW